MDTENMKIAKKHTMRPGRVESGCKQNLDGSVDIL